MPPLLQKILDLEMKYAIWFSIDTGNAVGLFDGDGTLRPNGDAFREFMDKTFADKVS